MENQILIMDGKLVKIHTSFESLLFIYHNIYIVYNLIVFEGGCNAGTYGIQLKEDPAL